MAVNLQTASNNNARPQLISQAPRPAQPENARDALDRLSPGSNLTMRAHFNNAVEALKEKDYQMLLDNAREIRATYNQDRGNNSTNTGSVIGILTRLIARLGTNDGRLFNPPPNAEIINALRQDLRDLHRAMEIPEPVPADLQSSTDPNTIYA